MTGMTPMGMSDGSRVSELAAAVGTGSVLPQLDLAVAPLLDLHWSWSKFRGLHLLHQGEEARHGEQVGDEIVGQELLGFGPLLRRRKRFVDGLDLRVRWRGGSVGRLAAGENQGFRIGQQCFGPLGGDDLLGPLEVVMQCLAKGLLKIKRRNLRRINLPVR